MNTECVINDGGWGESAGVRKIVCPGQRHVYVT